MIDQYTQDYIKREYTQAMREFRGAITDDAAWTARKKMASLEKLAYDCGYSTDFVNSIRTAYGLKTY